MRSRMVSRAAPPADGEGGPAQRRGIHAARMSDAASGADEALLPAVALPDPSQGCFFKRTPGRSPLVNSTPAWEGMCELKS